MQLPASPARLFVEGLLAASAGAAASAAIYSDFWQECCRAFSAIAYFLLIPSFAFAIVLGGGVHSASKVHYYIGVVLQFLVMWFLVRWLMAWRRNQPSKHSSKPT